MVRILFNSPSGELFLRFNQIAKMITPAMTRTPAAAAPEMTAVFIPPVSGFALGFEPDINILNIVKEDSYSKTIQQYV